VYKLKRKRENKRNNDEGIVGDLKYKSEVGALNNIYGDLQVVAIHINRLSFIVAEKSGWVSLSYRQRLLKECSTFNILYKISSATSISKSQK